MSAGTSLLGRHGDVSRVRVPWFEVVLRSPLSEDEICARLAAKIDSSSLGRQGQAYAGAARRGRFRLTRGSDWQVKFGSSVLVGRATSTPSGSYVCARVRPNAFMVVWLCLWTYCTAKATAGALVAQEYLVALGVFASLVLPWAFVTWTIRVDGRDLIRVLETECATTVVPRDTPTPF